MKAIRVGEFGGPEVLKLEDVTDPQAGAGQVVVRVRAAGVNPVDTYVRSGAYAVKPELPYTPGFDAAGEGGAGREGGGVGAAAVQMARAAGFEVIGTGGTDEGRKLVAEQGAHHVLDHHAPDYLEQLTALTGGRGVDVILEMLANVNLNKDLGVLAKGGRVVVIGSRGDVEINPRLAMGRDAAILGMTLFNVSPQDLASIHAALVAGLEAGTLRPVVGREVPLADAARAHEEVMKPGAYGKTVLTP